MRLTTSLRRFTPAVTVAVLAANAALLVVPAGAKPDNPGEEQAHCAREGRIVVPGAEVQRTSCLNDLTTAGTVLTGHTNQNDWSGLHATGTKNPRGVPGIQVDGYFPDESTRNTNNGWNHDSQFVIRVPDHWNGGVVITGAPGVRAQYANDFIISDWVLSKGYAFASTDKGNVGMKFYADGSDPGGSIAEWNQRVTQLTEATKEVVEQRYEQRPKRTYMFGISNGGYLTRWQLENNPKLYDGGVDWEGTLFRAEGPNLMSYLPTALKHYKAAAAGDRAAHDAMIDVGFAEGSEFLWDHHYAYYWDLTQRIYREELDPEFDGELDAGIPYCLSGMPRCDADYDYASRPASVEAAVRAVELTGDIGKPMLTIHGSLDALLPPATDSDVYDDLVEEVGAADRHRYYTIEDGTHTDGLYTTYPDKLRPLLPCARSAFDLLTGWVEGGQAPPGDATYARPPSGDLLNTCEL